MTLIDDAKKLIDDCYKIEDLIFHLITFHYNTENTAEMKKVCEQVWEMVNKCCEIKRQLHEQRTAETATLCNHLNLMSLRLESAILYAKNYFKFDSIY
ncbi:MAG: hypothetical protein LBC02_02405 [Planctomycetaceae bacterium]|jgi:hypothetical protein|nr:hypothetical protein [Planctomycetaceae bacterium]